MSETATYCVNHPDVETLLRCKKCENYICTKCAVRTPTGYQCKSCTRAQQKAFETAKWYDYIIGFAVAGVLSLIASFIVNLVGSGSWFGLIIIMAIAPSAGAIIAAILQKATQRRRSRALYLTIGAGLFIGTLPLVLINLLIGDLWGLLFQGIYLALVVPTAYYRLSGIQLFK